MSEKKQGFKFIISGGLLFILFVFIYKVQIEYEFGDIPLHLKAALAKTGGYSLNTWVFYYLSKYTLPDNMGIALFLAFVSTATIIVGYRLLKYMDRKYNVGENNWILWVISCIVPFLGSIYIPKLYPYFYENTISPIVWHNATVIEMKLFGLISLLYFFRMYYEAENISGKDWILFTIALLLCNAFKPSYMLGFAPVTGIWLLVLLKKDRANFKKVILIGTGIVISALPLFCQWIELYGENGSNSGGGIAFVPGGRLLQTGEPFFKVICGLPFVIIMMIFGYKWIEKDRTKELLGKFWFVNGMTVVNFLIYSFFLEKTNSGAGNLAWGLKGILYFTYLMDLYTLVRAYREYRKQVLVISIIPVLQLASGVAYTALLLSRHSFYF